jgi:hypothetical protein
LNVARARKPEIPKYDAERALTVLKYAKKTEPKYGKPNSFGAYLMFLIGLAIAGLIVYYAFNHTRNSSPNSGTRQLTGIPSQPRFTLTSNVSRGPGREPCK